MKSKLKYRICKISILSLLCLISNISFAQISGFSNRLVIGNYSRDSLNILNLPLRLRSEFLSPFDYRNQSPLFLKNPANLETLFSYDSESKQFVLTQKMGSLEYRKPQIISFKDYQSFTQQKSLHDYWKQRSQTSSGDDRTGIIPSIYVKNKAFDQIFGSRFIDIRPQGSAELSFGVMTNNRKDETLDVKRRKTTNFDFNEKIQMSVVAKIGDKIEFKTNYNTESTFDFENQLALKYQGKEDEIIQLIEAGNVNFTLPTSLITGSQSLFGVKTQLQFGRTTITGVFSQQNGQSSTINVQNGAQVNEFKLSALDYEENRHFFLAQYFREDIIGSNGKPSNRYNEALKALPIISSNINITKIEVWVTNIGAAVTQNRNIIALNDLGEFDPYSDKISQNFNNKQPSNFTNDLLTKIDTTLIRSINTVAQYLKDDPFGIGQSGYFVSGDDFEKIESARKLNSSEYTFNKQLGFLSLNTSLNSDQTLAVAFQYAILGSDQVYQVGEFSEEGTNSDDNLIVKLLKSTIVNTKNPIWDLMMKNVYSMRAYQINPDDFVFNILYSDNKLGVPTAYFTEGQDNVKGVPIIKLLNMDNLDPQGNPFSDGVFDFIDRAATNGGTIQASNGRIFFPVLEPFGKDLRTVFMADQDLADKYAYDSLYTTTKTNAEQFPEKNKFILEGFFKSSSSNEIALNAFNVPQGSVKVTAGGIPLTENVDYTVDYTLGRVRIMNDGILNSGTPIRISLESNSLFSLQTKRYMGTHVNYALNDHMNFGGTIINLNERPLTQKTNYGEDPISNTIWGLNFNFDEDSRFLTKLIDKIPFIDTKAPSRISFEGEFAQFMPGHSKIIGNEGTSYVDDFEGSKSTIDLMNFSSWILASTPQGQLDVFPEAAPSEGISYGKNRAKLSWYIIDPLFYDRNSNIKPPNISTDELSKHSVRQVLETEVFPNKDIPNGIPTNISVLNMAFSPDEKGPYNYDVEADRNLSFGIDDKGKLNAPESRWGGMMRKMESTNFEATNIEYIEFWMMDPFTEDETNSGKLYFNLGDISEDILRDSRKSYENGLPLTDQIVDVDTTIWGRVPRIQTLVESFNNETGARIHQDVGYDGLNDVAERSFFSNEFGLHSYLDDIQRLFGANSVAYQNAFADPSNDNYHYFRGTDYDENELFKTVVERYKLFNNAQGNSPTADQNIEVYPTSASALPNIEDINRDNTLSEAERYFQYEIELAKDKMIVGQNYITDVYEATTHQLPNGNIETIKWYQFKIPVSSPSEVIGSIQDFKSIRFLRTFMRDFERPVVLRFATLELVRGEWRRYKNSLLPPDEFLSDNTTQTSFDITAVNIEENGRKVPIPYVIPPGIERETNIATTNIVRRNEQSMVMKVGNLVDGDSRAAYKTTDFDFRQYKRLKMFVHAEKLQEQDLEYGELSVFIRLGSDFNENYYEYEIPLTFTPWGTSAADPLAIWPEENNFDIILEELVKVKQDRNVAMRNSATDLTTAKPYTVKIGDHKITVLGIPSISDIKAIMVGVRNPKQENVLSGDDGLKKSAELWINELRLVDFKNEGGWAATGRFSADLADLARLSVSGSYSTSGFGSVEQKINETPKESVSTFDFSTDIKLGKFFPKKSGIKIPLHFDYSKAIISPEYNPLNPDVKLKDELDSYSSNQDRDSLRSIVQDYVQRKNINLINVRKDRVGAKKPRIYDVENLNVSYAYSEIFARNIDVAYDMKRVYRGGFGYNFRNNPKPIRPFKNLKLSSKYWRIIKDFNFNIMPKVLSFNTDMYREHNKKTLRNKSRGIIPMKTYFKKRWDWNRNYNIQYDLTQNLNIDFKAKATAYINEPQGNPEKGDAGYEEYQQAIWKEIKRGGSINRYNHSITINYNLPLNKIPIFDWVSSQFRYLGTYNWQASAQSVQERLGNSIENSRQIQWNGNLNFAQLYNKSPFLRKLNRPSRRAPSKQGLSSQFSAGFQSGGALKAVKDSTKNAMSDIARTLFEGLVRMAISVKKASFNYTKTEGIFLPGFLPEARFLGNSRSYQANENISSLPDYNPDIPSGLAPGIGFVFGNQSDIRLKAIQNGWISTDTLLNQAYSTKYTTNLSIKISLEPLPNLKIDLTADRAYSMQHREYFRVDSDGRFQTFSPTDFGSFSMSFIAFKSAFNDEIGDNISRNFENMKDYRKDIAVRLAQQNPNWGGDYFPVDTLMINGVEEIISYPVGYGPNSQDVLLHSFLAAYTGKDPTSSSLSMLPKIPIPNWRITYSGLTKIKAIGAIFRNITISHAYRASYNIGNFQSNINRIMQDGFPAALYSDGHNYIPEFDIAMVSISEQFVPLFSIDVVLKNNMSVKLEFKKSRNLSLSFANFQITEIRSDEVLFGFGYRIQGVNFGIKTRSEGGRSRSVKSDLNIKANFSLRSNKTTLRRIDENINQISTGQRIISINTSADYMVSKKFNIRVYYDKVINNPFVSSQYPNSTSNGGFSLRFLLN